MLHLIGCFVGLAGVVVVPEEDRLVNSAKLQIIPIASKPPSSDIALIIHSPNECVETFPT